ncbi:MAG TPA: hypothetical protein VMD97_04820 [Candidatus Aquilonibacter sp.]|nr:hypothetical protein [Candidatus Aquilonibacter sp.]
MALGLVALLFAAATLPARAEISLLLEEPYGGLGMVNPTGHAAIYLNHVCAATPTELRPCRPGELGVVIARYDGISDLDWIAIPLVPYLYAVENPADIPNTIDRKQEDQLRDLYRRHALESVAPDMPDGSTPPGNWYELVGSAFDRKIYGFSISTTPDQDASLIAMFNDRRNVERYNGAFRNCADFARTTINHIYPHAIRRNFIADFGFTTPKSVARGLSRYASKHPGVELHFFVIPQVPGTIPRSYGVEDVTESLLKRYGVPLVVLSPLATSIVFVAYLGHGRFDMPRKAPVLDLRPPVVSASETLTADETANAPPVTVPIPLPSAAAPLPSGLMLRSELPPSLTVPSDPSPVVDAPLAAPAPASPDAQPGSSIQ